MINKSPIITSVVLALFAIASPLSKSRGTAYSGTPPGASNFTFTHTKVALAGEHLKNRYAARAVESHGIIVGEESEDKALKSRLGSAPLNVIDKRQWGVPVKVPIARSVVNEWTVPVSIGAHSQQFTLLLDTGSPALWVPSVSCTADRCTNRNKYDPSSTEPIGEGSITYGDGSTAEGPIYNDTITISNVQVTAPFIVANYVMDTTSGDAADGILGIDLNSFFFTALWNQNQQLQRVVGFKLSDPDPEMDIGGLNYDLIIPDAEWHPVIADGGFWTIGSTSIYVTTDQASFDISGNDNARFDTGSELIIGPADKVEDIYSKIGGKPSNVRAGQWIFPCDGVFSMEFSWNGPNGVHWKLSSSDFAIAFAFRDSVGPWCEGAVSSMAVPGFPANTWLVGTPLLKNYYIAFSYLPGPGQVGLAKLKA